MDRMWVWKRKDKDNYKVLAWAPASIVINVMSIIILQFVAFCCMHLKKNSELPYASL